MAERITVEQAVEAYLRYRAKARKSPETINSERGTLYQLVRLVGPNKNMALLTRQDLEDFFYGQPNPKPCRCTRLGLPCVHVGVTERVAGATFNVYLYRVREWEKWCRSRGWIKSATPLCEEIERVKEDRRDHLRLTGDETYALLDAARWPRDRAAIAFGLDTGSRASEVGRALIKDLELDEGYLTQRRTKSKKYGLELRRLAMTPELHDEMRKWLVIYATDLDITVDELLTHGDWYLFPSQHPAGPSFPGVIHYRPTVKMYRPGEAVRRALVNMGADLTDQRVGMHTTRRTAGRLAHDHAAALQAEGKDVGDPLRFAQMILGHATREMTEKYLGETKDAQGRDKLLLAGSFRRKSEPTGTVVPLRAVEGGR